MAPSASAVYSAIAKVAPVWNSANQTHNILPQDDTLSHEWLDYTWLITHGEFADVDLAFSYLYSDGQNVKFAITCRLEDSSLEANVAAFSFPVELAPKRKLFFPYGYTDVSSSGSIPSKNTTYFTLTTAGAFISQLPLLFGENTEAAFAVCSGSYTIR
jgi:hypothetical protein